MPLRTILHWMRLPPRQRKEHPGNHRKPPVAAMPCRKDGRRSRIQKPTTRITIIPSLDKPLGNVQQLQPQPSMALRTNRRQRKNSPTKMLFPMRTILNWMRLLPNRMLPTFRWKTQQQQQQQQHHKTNQRMAKIYQMDGRRPRIHPARKYITTIPSREKRLGNVRGPIIALWTNRRPWNCPPRKILRTQQRKYHRSMQRWMP
mmetsp:Transcript_20036/g.46860  ORF Transcript_20036/g.46860 Transcript_20036/m.46860 type:complete len:202 (+) Transcript_20036:474-1079(+)